MIIWMFTYTCRTTPTIVSRCFPDVLVIFAIIYEWKQTILMSLFCCIFPSGMTYGTTIRDLCLRLNPHALRIDEQRLVRFGVLKGIIRRIQKVKIKNFDCSKSLQITSFHNLSSFPFTSRKINEVLKNELLLLYIDCVVELPPTTRSAAAQDCLTMNLTIRSRKTLIFVWSGNETASKKLTLIERNVKMISNRASFNEKRNGYDFYFRLPRANESQFITWHIWRSSFLRNNNVCMFFFLFFLFFLFLIHSRRLRRFILHLLVQHSGLKPLQSILKSSADCVSSYL